MTSLLAHAALGVLTVVLFFVTNAHLYRRDSLGSRTTFLEGLYYGLAGVSVCIGWYFNQKYVFTYPEQASWVHFTTLPFGTPAGGSVMQDIIITNAILGDPRGLTRRERQVAEYLGRGSEVRHDAKLQTLGVLWHFIQH